jgi:hypothetical protein
MKRGLQHLSPFRFRLLSLLAFSFLLSALPTRAVSILIPMDDVQKDHLKSYGIAFWALQNGGEVDWLLNYRGGSFMTKYEKKLKTNVKYVALAMRCYRTHRLPTCSRGSAIHPLTWMLLS